MKKQSKLLKYLQLIFLTIDEKRNRMAIPKMRKYVLDQQSQ